jgi:hypothetical protein
MREHYKGHQGARYALLFMAVVAASMLMGDGVLTPSISGRFPEAAGAGNLAGAWAMAC